MTQAVGKLSKSHKKSISPIRKAQITLENEIHWPYECGVCRNGFRSRHELATHSHEKRLTVAEFAARRAAKALG